MTALAAIVAVIPTTLMLLGMWVAWLALEFAHDGGDISTRCPASAACRREPHPGYTRAWTADPGRVDTLWAMWAPATHRPMNVALKVHAIGMPEVRRVAA